jgi:hypothetical protein
MKEKDKKYLAIIQMYESRQSRETHPDGSFDSAGRWYPSDDEECPCCMDIRSPSRAYPFSLMRHCRTRKHIRNLLG